MDVFAKIGGAAGVIIITLLVAGAIPVKTSRAANSCDCDEATLVSCYKGNTEEGNYIGDLTAPIPEIASQSCNSQYAACQRECSGCFADYDITEDVCYDRAGRKFLN